MTDRGCVDRSGGPEALFWNWWTEGVRGAGVREVDLPELHFVAGFTVERDGTAGMFEVHHDPVGGRLRTSIWIREDLCRCLCVRLPPEAVGLPPTDPLSFADPNRFLVSDAVLMLALQCAHYEQFAWRYWRLGRSSREADRDATRRASALVPVWLAGRATYRAPRYSRGTEPVRYADRHWWVEDDCLVSTD